MGDERYPWTFDLDRLYKPGTLLFIFEDGSRIGLGEVKGNSDYGMHVEISFTGKPHVGNFYYGLISDSIDKKD